MVGVDAVFLISGYRLLAEHVATDFADEGYVAAEARGCNSLICSLAARPHLEFAAEDCLSGDGNARCLDDHVGI